MRMLGYDVLGIGHLLNNTVAAGEPLRRKNESTRGEY